ncbi:MAG: TrkH family potassium uptake protein [Gammaproteobacteria bacterium]
MIAFSSVRFLLGLILFGLAILMLVPCVYAWYIDSPDLYGFLISEGVTAFSAAVLCLFRKRFVPQIRVREMFLLTTLSWFLVCAFGALPFILSHAVPSFTDAVFESVSGVTTTGATVFNNLDQQPRDILLWRSMMQWIGGLGLIALGAAILPFLRIGGMRLFQTESSDFSEKALPRTRIVLTRLTFRYLMISVACAIAYVMAGMSVFDGLNHAMTTVSTGGFSTHDTSISFFRSAAVESIAAIFMLIAAVPFMLYLPFIEGRIGGLFRDQQVYSMLGAYAYIVALLLLWLTITEQESGVTAFREAAFSVISIGTTTGYVSVDYTSWGGFAMLIFFFLGFVGGCSGSTSGGIKIFRFKLAFVMFRETIQRLLHPNRIFSRSMQGRPITDDIVASVMAFSLAFSCTVGIVAVILGALGNDFETSLSAAATATANVGPGIGDTIGPVYNFASLTADSKWIICIAMLLGRLEIFTILIVLTPAFWRN